MAEVFRLSLVAVDTPLDDLWDEGIGVDCEMLVKRLEKKDLPALEKVAEEMRPTEVVALSPALKARSFAYCQVQQMIREIKNTGSCLLAFWKP